MHMCVFGVYVYVYFIHNYKDNKFYSDIKLVLILGLLEPWIWGKFLFFITIILMSLYHIKDFLGNVLLLYTRKINGVRFYLHICRDVPMSPISEAKNNF